MLTPKGPKPLDGDACQSGLGTAFGLQGKRRRYVREGVGTNRGSSTLMFLEILFPHIRIHTFNCLFVFGNFLNSERNHVDTPETGEISSRLASFPVSIFGKCLFFVLYIILGDCHESIPIHSKSINHSASFICLFCP